jgi:hypothetical protein
VTRGPTELTLALGVGTAALLVATPVPLGPEDVPLVVKLTAGTSPAWLATTNTSPICRTESTTVSR